MSQDSTSSRCDSPTGKPLSNDKDESESPPARRRQSLIDSVPVLSPLNECPEQSYASNSSLEDSSQQEQRSSRYSSGFEGSPKPNPEGSPLKSDLKGSPKHKTEGGDQVDTPAVETSGQAVSSAVCSAELYSCIVRTPSSDGVAGHTNEG